jgi:hypothetical protein
VLNWRRRQRGAGRRGIQRVHEQAHARSSRVVGWLRTLSPPMRPFRLPIDKIIQLPSYLEFADRVLGEGFKKASWHLQLIGTVKKQQQKGLARALVSVITDRVSSMTVAAQCFLTRSLGCADWRQPDSGDAEGDQRAPAACSRHISLLTNHAVGDYLREARIHEARGAARRRARWSGRMRAILLLQADIDF